MTWHQLLPDGGSGRFTKQASWLRSAWSCCSSRLHCKPSRQRCAYCAAALRALSHCQGNLLSVLSCIPLYTAPESAPQLDHHVGTPYKPAPQLAAFWGLPSLHSPCICCQPHCDTFQSFILVQYPCCQLHCGISSAAQNSSCFLHPPLCACRQLDCRDRELTSKRSDIHQLSRQQADLIRATEETERRLTDIQDSIGQADDEVILEAATVVLAAAVRHKAWLHSSKGSACRLAHSALSQPVMHLLALTC